MPSRYLKPNGQAQWEANPGKREIMRSDRKKDHPQLNQEEQHCGERPEIFALRRGKSGWELSHRSLIQAAAAVTTLANASTRLQAQGCPSAGRTLLGSELDPARHSRQSLPV